MARAAAWSDLDKAVALCLLDPGVIIILKSPDLRYPHQREIVIDVPMLCRALYDYLWSQRHAG